MKFTDVKKDANTSKRSSANGNGEEYAIPLVEVTEVFQEPLILMIYGDPGAGKSRLIGTAPDPIGVLPMEHKSRQSIVRMAQELGKRVIMPETDLVRTSRAMLTTVLPDQCFTADMVKGNYKDEDKVKVAESEMQKRVGVIPLDGAEPKCCQRCFYRYHANRVKSVALRMAQRDDIRTIAIDTFGQLVDDMLFANYGRNERIMPLDRKCFNQEVREFLNELTHKNLVLTHHTATIWKDNKPTNKTKPMSAFAKIGHYANVVAKMSRDEVRNSDGGVDVSYLLTVEDCQANASLIGSELLRDDAITFSNLAYAVYPDAPDGWFD